MTKLFVAFLFTIYQSGSAVSSILWYPLTGLKHSVLVQKTKIWTLFKITKVQTPEGLITVQQDATYSVYYISVGSSTCFGC